MWWRKKKNMTNNVSTLTTAITNFTQSLTGRNVSPHTITAYQTDLRQFILWIADSDISVIRPDQMTRYHISKYLSFLAAKGLTGVTRARKLASIREFFKSLVDNGTLPSSPAASTTPCRPCAFTRSPTK
jgi:site-specific recombinase XerD